MSKRSDQFERVEKDYYPTIDLNAGRILANHLFRERTDEITYAEPCYGQGHLEKNLNSANSLFQCRFKSDIDMGIDALTLTKEDLADCEMIITNPPWSRQILHSMIEHFSLLRPTWLLFDANWMNTKQSSFYMKDLCTDVVAVGRLKWIEGTTMSGKDDCSWYLFDKDKNEVTRFHGR